MQYSTHTNFKNKKDSPKMKKFEGRKGGGPTAGTSSRYCMIHNKQGNKKCTPTGYPLEHTHKHLKGRTLKQKYAINELDRMLCVPEEQI